MFYFALFQVESQSIRVVDPDVLDRLIDKTEDLVAIFYDPARKKHQVEENIDSLNETKFFLKSVKNVYV
jgi:hypothetical protein